MKSFFALLGIDLKLARRNKSVLFFNYFFPLIFFFFFGWIFRAAQGANVLVVVTMVIVLGIIGSGLFGAGMRAVQEREENILRRYKVTPITPVPLLLASMITGVILYLPTVLLILLLAKLIYGMQLPPNLFSLLAFVCVGAAAFRTIGLIIAAVVNSTQESNILIQPVYMIMLFFSGATIPLTFFPNWLQLVTQFVPATYVVIGLSGILQRHETLSQNWLSLLVLLVTACGGIFIATKLFRWEKEEKLRASAKLWVLVVLLPFFLLGGYQAWSRQDLTKAKILERERARGRSWLIQNARIIVGNGKVIEAGAVLVRNGKIDTIYEGTFPDAKALNAEPLDAAGKTVLPGLIDVHIHLGASSGFYNDTNKYGDPKNAEHELEAYLYCGVTAVRSVGDALDAMLRLHALSKDSALNCFSAVRFSPRKEDMERNISRMCRNRCAASFLRNRYAFPRQLMKRVSKSMLLRGKACTRSKASSTRAYPVTRSSGWMWVCCARLSKKRTQKDSRWQCTPATRRM